MITPLVVTVRNAMGVNTSKADRADIQWQYGISNSAPASNPAAKNPAAFIFATDNGTISAWGPPATPVAANGASTAIQEVDESKQGANFVGLTWVESEGNHFLLAANFSGNTIEMFDGNFKRVQLSREAFDDDRIPREFAPYNVQAVGASRRRDLRQAELRQDRKPMTIAATTVVSSGYLHCEGKIAPAPGERSVAELPGESHWHLRTSDSSAMIC